MLGKRPEDGFRRAIGAGGGGEVVVEAVQGASDGIGGFACGVADVLGVLLFIVVKVDEFAGGFGFDGFDLGVVIEDGFEFALLAEDGAHGLGLVEFEAAFVERGGGIGGHELAGIGVGEFERAGLAARGADSSGEVEGVDGFGARMGEEVGDVIEALLVFEDGAATVEGEFPETQGFLNFEFRFSIGDRGWRKRAEMLRDFRILIFEF